MFYLGAHKISDMPQPRTTHRRRVGKDPRRATVAILLILMLVLAGGAFFLKQREPDLQANAPAPSSTSPSASQPTSTSATKKPSKDAGDGRKNDAKSKGVMKDPATANAGDAPQAAGGFSMNGPATISGATYDVMPYQLPLNPAGPQATMVRWVDGLGVSPQKAREGTVYVLGHAWGSAPLVFNPISERVTAAVNLSRPPQKVNGTDNKPVKRYATSVLNGSAITMRDNQGKARVWKVTNSWLVDKNEAIVDPDVMAQHRRERIILIACAVSGDQDLGYNVIVEGQLA